MAAQFYLYGKLPLWAKYLTCKSGSFLKKIVLDTHQIEAYIELSPVIPNGVADPP